MYLARFDGSERSWLQGVVSMAGGRQPGEDGWWRLYAQLARSAGAIPGGSAAVRVTWGAGGLRQALMFVAPAEREAELRRRLASFTRLNLLAEDSIATADTREAHDEVAAGFPRLRVPVATSSYTTGEFWYGCDFRLGPALDELIFEARGRGLTLGYQANLYAVAVGASEQRLARKNALHVGQIAGIPPALAALQRRLAERLDVAVAVSEEYLGVETPEAAEWLREALRRRFLLDYAALRFDVPEFEFVEYGWEDSLATGLHHGACVPLALDEICSSALDDAAYTATLAWRPPPGLAPLRERASPGVPPAAMTPPAAGPAGGPLPVPYHGDQPYVFVSYKREDLALVAPILRGLVRRGYQVWYDRGIPGGAEWDALIEERIERCELLLAFISQRAVESRFVRRELKFADMLGKSIVAVRLQPAELAHGLRMFMNQYQVLEGASADLDDALDRAIGHSRAAARRAGEPSARA